MSHPKHYTKFSVTSETDCLKSQCHIEFTQKILETCFSSEMHIQKQCSLSTFFHEKCWRIELEAIHNQPDLSKSNLKIFITVAVLVIEKLAPSLLNTFWLKSLNRTVKNLFHISLCYILRFSLNCKGMRHIKNSQIPLTVTSETSCL